jgi:hypothetical protein
MAITQEQLLAEIEDLLRTLPPRQQIAHDSPEILSWLGRASAVLQAWDPIQGLVGPYLGQMRHYHSVQIDQGYKALVTVLHQARYDLRMKTVGPLSVAIPHGGFFDYFDEIRKVIEGARQDLLFVDPYLDAEFASRYLAHIAKGVSIRLLAREKLKTLVPAVEAFAKQAQQKVEVRSANAFHDRYVFVDNVACYQSGASFKDGAKTAPTTLTQITDAYAAIRQTYDDLWRTGNVEAAF